MANRSGNGPHVMIKRLKNKPKKPENELFVFFEPKNIIIQTE
jgi:hypothetical protein